jgi:hypothetical protein
MFHFWAAVGLLKPLGIPTELFIIRLAELPSNATMSLWPK